MLLFLTLTQSCNLNCKYCGSDENFDMEDLSPHPKEITYNFKNSLKKFKDVEDLIICFYGGEPLLQKKHILETFKILPKAKFVLQTNGTLLHKLGSKNVNKMDTILLSIDGDSKVTNASRGKDTYETVIKNASKIRKEGYKSDLVARMTVHGGSNIYDDVTHLLFIKDENGNNLFDHVHWQLDVLWDSPKYARWENYLKWRDENYNKNITKLIKYWLNYMKTNNKILGIAPFQRIMYSILTGEKVKLRCGSGIDSYNITTAGGITACPIAPVFKEIDSVENPKFDAKKLMGKGEKIGGPCLKCDVKDLCGGRCLAVNGDMWWGLDGFDEVCNTVRHLLKELQSIEKDVKKLIDEKKIKLEDLLYPKYNNTVEVIP